MIIPPEAYVFNEELVDEEYVLEKILAECKAVHVIDLYIELVEKGKSVSEVIAEAMKYKGMDIIVVFKGFIKLVEKLGVEQVGEIVYDLANAVPAIYIIPYSLWWSLDVPTKSRLPPRVVRKTEAQ